VSDTGFGSKSTFALLILSCVLVAPSTAAATVKFFHSPSKNIECEVRTGHGFVISRAGVERV
jgi:hypothetical protein